MQTLKDSGFNTIQTYDTSAADHLRILDRAQRYGMKVMLNCDRNLVKDPDGVEKMRAVVRRLKDHPALGFWYLYDEPAGALTADKLMPFYRMLREETPEVPVAVVNCWDETWDQYSNILDIQMVDTYPIRDDAWPDAPLQLMTTFISQAVALGKPVLPVVQTMSWKSFAHQLGKQTRKEMLRYPTREEMRYLMLSPLAQGVCGVFGFSFHHAMRTGGDPSWWMRDCAPAARELGEFVKLVKNPESPERFRRSADGNYLAARFKGREPGRDYLMMVNAWPLPRRNAGCYLDGKVPGRYRLVPRGSTRDIPAELKDSKIRLGAEMQPWEVMIWEMIPEGNGKN